MRRDAFENRQHLSSEIFSPNAKATDAHRCSSTSGFKTIRLPLKDPKQLRPQIFFLFFFLKRKNSQKKPYGLHIRIYICVNISEKNRIFRRRSRSFQRKLPPA